MKKLKLALLALAIIIICIGAYVLYEFKFKTYDVEDATVDAIINENYDVELPDEAGEETLHGIEKVYIGNHVVLITKDNKIISVEDSKGKPIKSEIYKPNLLIRDIDSQQKEVISEQGEVIKVIDSKMSVETIKDKYTPYLSSLEQQAEERINTLISHAKEEYNQKKLDGEKVSVGYFYSKYMEASKSLESSTDEAFDVLLSTIEKDLIANGHSEQELQIFKSEYQKQKDSLSENLKSKALNALK